MDVETGGVRLLDHVVVQDVGRALNPAAIDGQIGGAVAQGAGWALLERMAYGSDGRLMSDAKGVGEPPVVAAGAAIANAIADATGHRFVDPPIRAEAIVQAAGEGM